MIQLQPNFGTFAFSSAISTVTVRTEAQAVDVALYWAEDPDAEPYFAERYYTHQGRVTLHDFGSIIEQVMRQTQSALTEFRLTATAAGDTDDAAEAVFTVLYCDRAVDVSPSDVIEQQFLTSLPVRLTSGHMPEPLFYVMPKRSEAEAQNIRLHITYRLTDTGQTKVLFAPDGYTVPKSLAVSLGTYIVNYDDITAKVSASVNRPFQVLGVTVEIGRRSATLLYRQGVKPLRFYFCNMFNVPEVAEIQAVTTAKQKVKTAEAVCDGSLCLYDHSVTQEYEVEADGLSLDRARWLAQMLASRDVRLIDRPMGEEDFLNENYPEILITDSTCELSDGDDELSKIKFTYRFAAERPLSGLAVADRIHTSQYKNQFN